MNAGDRWIYVGDSTSAGIFIGSPPVRQSAENLITTNLAKNTGCYIQNLSWGGARVADGNVPMFGWASNFSTILRVSGPPVAKGLIIALGTNDWAQTSVSGAEFIASYRGMVRAAKFHGLAVVGMTPLWRSDGANRPMKADGAWNIVEWGGLIADICSQEGAKFINGYEAPLTPANFGDGVHPDEAGHLLWEPYVRTKMQGFNYMN
ncbi:GDSL-type esterase/lipase family protein [Achromobacter seleniivolatilans]|uniref:GDSL-type esterase/lipase family protein n=1 Tax=Achromobacter seleniivolatilans TaxID=3047478 RepID=A0ABY9M8E3_9BURK|nr:GDSL-type esterase/lipase family protein [Achromobacter sp. R39]WMD23289.1 GDSL-type esterase/lipase family protein [Achromobacter sp. R39]